MVDGMAKAVHHRRGDQQRHEEIKVLTPKARALGHHLIRQRGRFRAHLLQGDNNTASRALLFGFGAASWLA
jgi:hypothetical protein